MLHRNGKFYTTTDGTLQIDQVTDDRKGTGKDENKLKIRKKGSGYGIEVSDYGVFRIGI